MAKTNGPMHCYEYSTVTIVFKVLEHSESVYCVMHQNVCYNFNHDSISKGQSSTVMFSMCTGGILL